MKTRNIVLVALFTALMAVGARLSFNIGPIPLTLQFFFCALSGLFLGSRLGATSQIVYLMLGLVGAPVFANGGGIGYVVAPSFGYLLGFIVCAYIIGYLTENTKKVTFLKMLSATLVGLTILYVMGVLYMFGIYRLYIGKDVSLWWAIYNGAVVCISGDIISSLLCALISTRLIPQLRKIGYIKNSK